MNKLIKRAVDLLKEYDDTATVIQLKDNGYVVHGNKMLARIDLIGYDVYWEMRRVQVKEGSDALARTYSDCYCKIPNTNIAGLISGVNTVELKAIIEFVLE